MHPVPRETDTVTTRLAIAGAACALLTLAAPAGAQDALVAARPAAPTTIGPAAGLRDTAAAESGLAHRRPSEAAVTVRRAPSYRRDAVRGALVGTGVGLAVGVLAYRNNQRKCDDCIGNDAIPVLVTGAGTVLGFVAGSLAYLVRSDAAPAW